MEKGKTTKYLVAPVTYVVMDGVNIIDVNTSSGGTTVIVLQPIDISNIRKKLYVNDVSNNASVGKIIIQTSGGNLINNASSITLESNGISAEIEISDKNRFIANLNNDDPTPPLSDKNFVHQQVAPSTMWSVPHNLNKKVCVNVTDNSGIGVIGRVRWVSDNEVEVYFNTPRTGYVFCN